MLKRFVISLIVLFLIFFIFFFWSKKISYILNCGIIYFFDLSKIVVTSLIVVSSIWFFSLKRFFKSLITLCSVFFLFSNPSNFHQYILWKILINLLKKRKSIIVLEKVFEKIIFKVIQVILNNSKILWIM